MVNAVFTNCTWRAWLRVMLWIALALTATAAPNTMPDQPPVHATRQAIATVRIVHPAIVRLGKEAIVSDDLAIRATATAFRDADGRDRPARIVEFP